MTALEFDQSIAEISETLKPYAFKLTKNHDEANDLLQETLLKALKNRDKFQLGTNLKAWMYTILRNTFFTAYQKNKRRQTFVDSTDNLHFINNGATTITNVAFESFKMEDINRAIANVHERFSIPFLMYFKGFKYQEIAEKLDIPIGTVKNRIHVARKRLQPQLAMYID
ncbi:MAG: RNA polymerase sigma factor (sigma-70 family) [Arenicella sp.]|jgi:RNA polymerase sigma factor (sigma-70 family)